MKPNSLAFRLIASAMLWCGVAMVVGGVVLASIFQDTVERRFDDRLISLWESLVASAELDETGQLVEVGLVGDLRFQQTFSGWYWQILPEASLREGEVADIGSLRSRSLWDEDLEVPLDVVSTTYTRTFSLGPEAQDLRIVARKIFLPGADQPYIILIAADRRELISEIDRFNATLFWAFAALAVGLIIAMLIQIRVGLSPLRDVGRALNDIRSGRAAKLDGDFPSEITPLADELNALMTHNEEVLERSRTQVGNLAHALKTPLSVLTNEIQSNPGPLADTAQKQASAMKRFIDHYLARARTAAKASVLGARTDIGEVVDDLSRTIKKIHRDKEIELTCNVKAGLFFRGERHDLEEVIGNLLDNAFKWADQKVMVQASLAGDSSGDSHCHITIDDDGPGLSEQQRAEVLQRGARLDEEVPGSGLGLSIVVDTVDLYGGSFGLTKSSLGGVRAELHLPTASVD